MKKFNILKFVFFTAAVFGVLSCSNKIEKNESAYILLSVDGTESARTVFPSFDKAQMSDFVLKAMPSDGASEEKTIGTWATYGEFISSKTKMDEGTYDFTLTAKSKTNLFKGCVTEKTIQSGYNSIEFNLEIEAYGDFTAENNKGSLSYTINWTDSNSRVKEVWVYYDFYSNFEKNGNYSNSKKLEISHGTDTNNYSVVFEKDDFDCYTTSNCYVALLFKLFYGETKDGVVYEKNYVKNVRDFVLLAPDVVSKENKTLSLDEEAHTITYVFDVPDESLIEGDIIRSFNTADKKISIPQNITYPNKNFIGFYKNSDFSDADGKVTLLYGDDLNEDLTFYAKWENVKFTITYELNDSNDSHTAAKGTNAPDEFDYFSDFAISDASRDYYEFDGWTITKDDGTVIEEKITEYTIPGFTYNFNLTFTANWKNGPVGTEYSSTTTVPLYSIIYADGTYSSLDDFNSWSEEKQNLAKNRAIGVVYNSTNRMMVALENEGGSQNYAGAGNVHGDSQVQYAYNSATSYVPENQKNVTGWKLAGADDTYSIVTDRDNFNNVIESIGGTTIKTNYWTSDIAKPTSSPTQYYGKTANVYGVYYWGSSLLKSNEFWVNSTTDLGGLLHNSKNSYSKSINCFPSDLGWLAVKQY